LIPSRGQKGDVQRPLAVEHQAHLWRFTLQLPQDHRYLLFNTTHCATRIPSVSVSNTRAYTAFLTPGEGPGSLDEREAALYGSLPIDGVAGVELVSEQSGKILQSGQIQGQGYYFEDVAPFKARLRLVFQDYAVVVGTISMYDPKAPYAALFVRHDVQLVDIVDGLAR
jgi:hypothetical protein